MKMDEKYEVQRSINFARAHGVIIPKWLQDLAKKHEIDTQGVKVVQQIPVNK